MNKYRKWYVSIINNAKAQKRIKGQDYFEAHHILPKSLFPLWTKRPSNLVLLTAREHFICHLLLTRIYPSYQMNLAYWRLASDGKRKVTSREYERAKKLLSSSEQNATWKCTKVICLNTLEIFESINAAEEIYNKSKSRKRYIGQACKNHGHAFKSNGEPLFWEFYQEGVDYKQLYEIRLAQYLSEKNKLREIKRENARKQTNRTNKPHKIMCVELNQVFKSKVEAIKVFGYGIKDAVDKPNKTVGGYHWVSVD